MASGEGAAVAWEVGPTREVVRALIETLVDPRLPSRVCNDPPTEDDEESVARQIHAVVLLYNYYHRKQKPELEFLDFISFCKLAATLRPPLIPFMKTINGNEFVGPNVAEDQLSVTEKAIKNACDIALSLDASKDAPITERCLVSKVAVLLIDSKRENCLLRFGSVTEGVWSLIEKEINGPSVSREMCKKRKTNNQQMSTDDNRFLQLVYDAVRDVLGMDGSEVGVLESHVVYSLSKVNSAARFYMMQCPQSFNAKQSVPLQFLVDSLNGPLAEKFCDSWSTTPFVEFFHMLPYVGLIADWLPRKDSCLPTYNARITYEKESTILSLPLSEPMDTSSSETKVSSSKDYQEKNKHSSGSKIGSYLEFLQSTTINGTLKSAKNGGNGKVDNNVSKKHERSSLSGPSKGLPQSMVRDDNHVQRMNTRDSTKKKLNSKIGAYHQERENISSTHSPEDGVDLKVQKAGLMKSKSGPRRDENTTAENGDVAKACNQTEKAPCQLDALHKVENAEASENKVENAEASENLKNALALLDRRRQEVYSGICTMEDDLALYEHTIEQIRDGCDVELARKCIKSILSGKSGVEILDQSQTKTGFSCTFLPGQYPCQDLEYICLKNNWRMPRYFVRPSSDGKFVSSVVVQSNDFNLSSKGSEGSPCEARESAASQMIAKIRETCSQPTK